MSTKEVVNQAYTAFTSGDIPTLIGLFSDEIEYIIKGEPYTPYAGTYNGKEAVMGFFQKLGATVEFTKFDLIELIVEGNTGIGVINMATRVRSNGNTIESVIVHRIHTSDGKITRFEDFPDTKLTADAFSS